jgi:hypothetical protein
MKRKKKRRKIFIMEYSQSRDKRPARTKDQPDLEANSNFCAACSISAHR